IVQESGGANRRPMLSAFGMFFAVNAAALSLATIWIWHAWQLGEISSSGAILRFTLTVTACVAFPIAAFAAGHLVDIEGIRRKLLALDAVDDLTGLLKPRFFHLVLKDELDRVSRTGRPSAVFAFEIDKFHDHRDRYGHDFSDAMQMQVARAAHHALRGPFDKLARSNRNCYYGLLHDVSVAKAEEICDRIRNTIAEMPIEHLGTSAYLTLSVGYTSLAAQTDIDQAISLAENGLDKAKRFRGNKTCNGRY
ncbi:MAG: GGDEF domain-containing protein, partial [Pseudomonadota bacterium]